MPPIGLRWFDDAYFDYAKMYKQKGDTAKAKTQYRNALKYYEINGLQIDKRTTFMN